MHDIVAWFSAAITNWAILYTGGIFVAIIGVLRWAKSGLSKKAELTILCVFLVFAFFDTWRTEYLKTSPGLRLEVDTAATGKRMENGIVTAFFIVAISNLGSPSIADSWSLEVTPAGEKKALTFPPVIIHQDKPIEFVVSPTKTAVFDQKDALYDKTASTPVASGAKVTGYLTFDINGIDRSKLDVKGTRYRVICKDIFGNKIFGDLIGTGNGGISIPYFPGTTEPKFEEKQ